MRRGSVDPRVGEPLAGLYFELAELAPSEGMLPSGALFTEDVVCALLFLLDDSASPAPRQSFADNVRGSLGWLFPRTAWGDLRRRALHCERWSPFANALAAADSVRRCGEALVYDLRHGGLFEEAGESVRRLLRDLDIEPTAIGLAASETRSSR
jgi:hypothetical protein